MRASHVWSIRTKLRFEGRTRDLALSNLAIDSKLRGCDVVAARVDDVAPSGYSLDRATVRQKKTGRRVRFELTEQTRRAIDVSLRQTRGKVASSCFAVAAAVMASRHVNTPAWSASGSPVSASTRLSSAFARCAEPRQR